jgi:hypothetical protein
MMSEQNPTDEKTGAHCQSGACCNLGGWKLPLLLAIVFVAILVINGKGVRQTIPGEGDAATQADGPAAERAAAESADLPANQTVGLAIDFGDGRRREWKSIAWREAFTVADALAAVREEGVKANKVAALSFSQQGTGASAFLSEMDGVANEGAERRNWMYRVNGERADRSFAIYELKPGDQVLWTFGESR